MADPMSLAWCRALIMAAGAPTSHPFSTKYRFDTCLHVDDRLVPAFRLVGSPRVKVGKYQARCLLRCAAPWTFKL